MIDPARPFSARPAARSSEGGTAELSRLLQRARDERFRLLKLLQEARSSVDAATARPRHTAVQVDAIPGKSSQPDQAAAAPTNPIAEHKSISVSPSAAHGAAPTPDPPKLQAIVDKVATLNTRLDQKLDRLEQRQEQVRQALGKLATRAATEAKNLHAQTEGAHAAAGRLAQLREGIDHVDERVLSQLDRFDAHLAAYREDVERDMQAQAQAAAHAAAAQLQQDLQQQLDDHTARLEEARASVADQLTRRFDELADRLESRARDLITEASAVSDRARAGIRKQVVDAMAQAQDLQERLAERLADDRAAHRRQLSDLVDETDLRLLTKTREWDELLQSYEQRVGDAVTRSSGTAGSPQDGPAAEPSEDAPGRGRSAA